MLPRGAGAPDRLIFSRPGARPRPARRVRRLSGGRCATGLAIWVYAVPSGAHTSGAVSLGRLARRAALGELRGRRTQPRWLRTSRAPPRRRPCRPPPPRRTRRRVWASAWRPAAPSAPPAAAARRPRPQGCFFLYGQPLERAAAAAPPRPRRRKRRRWKRATRPRRWRRAPAAPARRPPSAKGAARDFLPFLSEARRQQPDGSRASETPKRRRLGRSCALCSSRCGHAATRMIRLYTS